MSPILIVKVYLLANAVLLASYGLFLSLRKLVQSLKLTVRHRQMIFAAQLLIFLSITGPVAFHFLPNESLPKPQWNLFHSASDTTLPIGDEIKLNKNVKSSNQVQSNLRPSSHNLLNRVAVWTNSQASDYFAIYFLFTWVIGFAYFSMRLVRNGFKLHTVLVSSLPIRKLGQVLVVVSDAIAVPFSTRLGKKSWIALPVDLLESGNDLRIALRHELQHHRQNDTSWAIFIEILICFFFPNPAIYLWKREITEFQEFSCDEALIGRKRISSYEYGSCLVRVAEAALGSRNMYVGTTCMASTSKNPFYFKSFLRRRIEMFTQHEKPRAHRWAGVVIGTMATLLTIAIAFGAEQSIRNSDKDKVTPGNVVVDPAIQTITEKVLNKAIIREGAKAGFAIVADPNTGKILAVANVDTTKTLKGYWALSEVFEPASTMKSLVAAAAIEKGLTSPDESHSCENGNYRYGDRVYHDWKKGGWAQLTTTEAIAFSSDICTIKLAERLGPQAMREMIAKFGFGPEGVSKFYPGSKSGELPPVDEDQERPRLIPYTVMGAGFGVSPIEMLQAYGAIANGGNLMKPQPANVSDSKAEVVRRVLSPETAKKMRGILEQVVRKGTAKSFGESDLYTTAGKTASSHYPRHMPFDGETDFAGFIGFAPVKKPLLEVYVGIRDPKSEGGAHGSNHAAPVFREIIEEVLKHQGVSPDRKAI